MTAKTRVLTALNHKSTDRVPLDLAATPETKQKLKEYFGVEEDEILLQELGIDIRTVTPEYVGPALENYSGQEWEGKDRTKPFQDIWGVRRRPVSYSTGHYNEICQYPLAEVESISDLDKFQWPQVDWWNMQNISGEINRISENDEYAILIRNGNIFETAYYMRGFNNMLIDLIIRPEFTWELMRRITEYKIAYLTALLEAGQGQIDLVFTADDIGTQTGLLMSLDLWRRMIKPHHLKMNTALKRFNIKILYHTDGAIMEAVPELIDMGVDVLNPLQFSAQGMDPCKLKEKYGHKLCFHGGIDVQTILRTGTPEDVRRTVKERIEVLGKDGGYIVSPSQAIQVDTPLDNILAIYDSVLHA